MNRRCFIYGDTYVEYCLCSLDLKKCVWTYCAAHPWAREGGDASDIPLDISVLSNMREFVKYSRLKQIALRVGHKPYPLTLNATPGPICLSGLQ